jgi:RNA polymerase sigma factor (sigma-70 family)
VRSIPHRLDAAAVAGDTPANFDELFHSFYPRLARLLYRLTGDLGRAEEVAAEAFCRLYQRPPLVAGNLEGWLYRTGLRLALDQLKKERRRARYEAIAAQMGLATTPSQSLDELDQEDERQRVRRVLARLKPAHVNLLVLTCEGLDYTELATALDLKRGSVGKLLSRARHAFRKEYVRRYGDY